MPDWLIPIVESYWLSKVTIFILRLLFIDDGVVDSDSR